MSNSNRDINAKLFQAVKKGDINEVRRLISEEANVNAEDDDEKTPLHFAAENGHEEEVKALLNKGANVNATDNKEETPFDLTTNEKIKTLLQNTAELLKVAKSGDIQKVNSLINEGANVNATDQNGKTPLHWAAVKGHKEAVEALLGKEGIDVNLADKKKDTPLHSVLKKDNIDINVLNALLGAEGINVNIKDELGKWTPLHWAVVKGHKEVVKALLGKDGINVNIGGQYGKKTPLHLAAQNNNKEVVEALLDKGANVNAEDDKGETPLDLATNQDIQTLLQNTAELLEVAKSGNIQKVNSLINEGASVNATDQNGQTPLHLAAKNGHEEVVKALLNKGANVNAKDNDEQTPLNLAPNGDIRTLLIDTALLEAVKKGEIDKVKSLIREGADVNALDTNLNNSLYWAVKNNHSTTAEVLLDNGADLHTFDPSRERDVLSRYQEIETEHSKNSLHLVAKLGNLEAVQDLLGKGANVNAQNDKGETPLDLATDDKIKTLLQNAEKSNPVDESLKDSEGVQKEKEEEDVAPKEPAQPVAPKEPAQPVSKEPAQPVSKEPAQPVSTEPVQTEEQPSSFFGSLFGILIKPFSLIGSFFCSFFSWLFGSDEPIQSSSESDQPVMLESLDNQVDNNII